LLNPARCAVWRGPQTLQLGADPEQALVLAGVTPAAAGVLALLDGTRTVEQVERAVAVGLVPGADVPLVRRLLELLTRCGVLLDAGHPLAPAQLSPTERARLDPDLASWSLAPADPTLPAPPPSPDPVGRLRGRAAAWVRVVGAGRVGALAASLLAAAGTGRVDVVDDRAVRVGDVGPGGHRVEAVGRPRGPSAADAARAAAPSVRTDAGRGHPDLVLLCPDGAVPRDQGALVAAGTAHLVATAYERVAVVGPLVRPGRSACLTCLDLHRVDRDPGWPLVAAQLSARGRRVDGQPVAPSCDVVLAGVAAALVTAAALAQVDDPTGDHDLSGARLELRPPDTAPRRRSWAPHPRCGCTWPGPRVDGVGVPDTPDVRA
jgi:hypothetical protein